MPIIAVEPLTDLVARMMQSTGSDETEARAIADNLVEANLMGHDSHGVGLAPRYMLHARTGGVTIGGHASIASDNGVYLLLDGNMGYGQVVGREAMELAIERARSHGVAIVGLRHAHHLGRIGAWGEMCAQAGFVSIHYVNATGHQPYVAPWGGYQARYSTNPVCTAIPATGTTPMILLDMATSRTAQGKVRVAHYKGVEMMPEALVGPNGAPTTDPGVIFREPMGAMLSFGQHKGYGLALMCEVLAGGMTGGGSSRPELLAGETICNNMLTILVDPQGFRADVPFAAEIDSLVAYVKSGNPAQGFDRIRVPGDPERETMAERAATGVPVDDGTWAEMIEYGLQAGMRRRSFEEAARPG